MVLQLLSHDEQFSRSISINWKAIVAGVLLAAGLAGGTYFWHDLQVKRNTPLVLAEAERRKANGEEASALGYYETYLGYRPDDRSALAEHALLKAKLVNSTPAGAEAFFTLARAAYYIPDRQDIRRELVKLGVRLNRVHDCRKDLDWLLETAPDDAEVQRLAGQAAVQEREFETARAHYQKCLELDPGHLRTTLELFRVLSAELKDFAAADALLDDILARHPDDGMLLSVAAGYYFDRGRLDLSEANLLAALQHGTAPKAALYQLQSEIARLRQRPRDLEASLTRLADLSDQDRRVELDLADVELALGRRAAAHARLLRIARDPRATAEQVWQSLLMLESAGFAEEMPALRERLKALDVEGQYLVSLAMQDRMQAGDWDGAIEISRGLMKRINLTARFTAQVSLWRADCFAKVGSVEEQLNALQRAVAAEPRNVLARSRFARLLFQSGKTQDAQTQYALLLPQSPRFAMEFVALLRDSQSPNSPFRLSRMEVDRLLDNWSESAPDSPLPLLCRIDLLRQLSESDAADALLAAGLRRWPSEIGFHLVKVEQLIRSEEWETALAQLDAADESCGLLPALVIARIECHAAAAPADLAARLESCVEKFRRLDRDGQAMVLPVLLRTVRNAKLDPVVVASLTADFGARNPHEPLVMLQVIQQFLDAGDFEAARRPLAELRTTLGEDAPLYRLAASMVDLQSARAGDAEAIAKLRAALDGVDLEDESAGDTFLTLKAELALLEKQPLQALRYLQQAVKSGRYQFNTLAHTLALMAAFGQLDQSMTLIKELLAAAKPLPDGAEATTLPQLASAAALREALEPMLERSWPLALIAFRLDLQDGDSSRASETLARAEELAPAHPVVAVTRLAYTERYAPNDLPDVVAALERKLSVVDQGLLLPPYLSKLKRDEDVEQLLEKARAAGPDDAGLFRVQVHWLRSRPRPDLPKLEVLLTETLNSKSEAQHACRQVARVELARLWALSRDYRVHRRAVEIAAAVLEDDSESEEARRLQVEVLTPHPAEWVAALDACRKLAESPRPELRAEGLFRESLIHERRKNWDEERRVLVALRESQPENPQWPLRLMYNAVHRKDRETLAELREQLAALSPDAATALRGDVLAAALADDRTEIVARVLAELREGKLSAAVADEWLTLLEASAERESLLQDAAKPDAPDTVVRFARFLGAQGQISPAIDKAKALWEDGYRDLAAGIVSELVVTTAITGAEAAEIRDLIIQDAEKDDAGLRMLLAAAAVAGHAGQLPQTQQLYRRVLRKEPDNVIALNNSAFLAALGDSKSGDDAIKSIKRAIEISGPVAQLQDTLGVLLLRSGDAEGALEQLSAAWEQAHDPAHGTHLAWTLTELGRFKEAAKMFDQVDRAEPKARLHALERDRDAAYRAKAKTGAGNP